MNARTTQGTLMPRTPPLCEGSLNSLQTCENYRDQAYSCPRAWPLLAILCAPTEDTPWNPPDIREHYCIKGAPNWVPHVSRLVSLGKEIFSFPSQEHIVGSLCSSSRVVPVKLVVNELMFCVPDRGELSCEISHRDWRLSA